MSSQLVQEFYLALSQERLEAYRPENGTDLEMLTNCFWNIDLVEALVPCLHATELALRNGIHRELTNRYQDEMWFYRPGGLDSRGLRELATALQKAAHKPPLLPGKLVAALTFGFWVMLLDSRYEQVLWQPNKFALQHAVFPNAQGLSRKDIARRFNNILELRNRAFHHEGIWYRPNLNQEHSEIHEAIGWISPTLQTAILSVDSFTTIFNGKAEVEADLRQRFNIA